jgi:hypothetical protein
MRAVMMREVYQSACLANLESSKNHSQSFRKFSKQEKKE